MSTSAQQIANSANAQKSTGPSTPEGKARSARNAYLHGLCSKNFLIGPEEQSDFDRKAEQYLFDLQPASPVEQTLFSEIVGAAWQLDRVRRLETEACAGKSSYIEMLDDEALQKKLDRLARHHTRIERTFHRCLKELKTLQAERKKEGSSGYLGPRVVVRESIDDQLARLNASALAAVSEQSQSAAPDDDDHILTPEELEKIDRNLDRMETNIARELQKRGLKAA